jgi:hypothetical protein
VQILTIQRGDEGFVDFVNDGVRYIIGCILELTHSRRALLDFMGEAFGHKCEFPADFQQHAIQILEALEDVALWFEETHRFFVFSWGCRFSGR